MCQYTVIKSSKSDSLDSQERLFLLNEEKEEMKLTDLVQTFYPRTVLAFHGKMGAGKTTLIRQLCAELGTSDLVNSPTFAIVNVYELPFSKLIYHFDCYRIKSLQEALDLGAEEYLYSGQLCLIEWPDVLEPILPDDCVHLYLDVSPSGQRILRFK